LQNFSDDEDGTEDKVVHDIGLSDINWELEQLDSVEEVKEGVVRISVLVVNFYLLKCPRTWQISPGI